MPKRTYKPRGSGAAKTAGVAAEPVYTGPAEENRPVNSDEVVTRKSRGERQIDTFDVPNHLKKRGYDYQWFAISVLGQPVDGVLAEAHEGGWRAVPASDMQSMLAPGTDLRTVDRRGQRLFMRPMHLTLEARTEDYNHAEQQKRDRMQTAMEGRAADGGVAGVRGVKPVQFEVSVQGEAGSYDRSPLQK
jgi:hypothetical protein